MLQYAHKVEGPSSTKTPLLLLPDSQHLLLHISCARLHNKTR